MKMFWNYLIKIWTRCQRKNTPLKIRNNDTIICVINIIIIIVAIVLIIIIVVAIVIIITLKMNM